MKKKTQMLIAVVGIFLFCIFLYLPPASASDLNDGLIAYYPFSGNAMDSSENKYNGIVNGAVLVKDKFGKENSAYNFTRFSPYSGNNIEIPVNINPNVMPVLTVTAWVKINSENKDIAHAVFSNDDWGWDRAMFNWYGNGWGITNSGGLTGYHPVEVDRWYFLVGVYNHNSKVVKIIIDNENIYQSVDITNQGQNRVFIGSSGHNSAYFDGVIDEFRIYNRELTDEELGELYKEFEGEDNHLAPFTFAHMTDIHIGKSWVPGHEWYEELSYPRFTDGLYEISRLAARPDFVLVSGDVAEYADPVWLADYRSMIDSFTEQTGIAVRTVPGNHDRYRGALGSVPCWMSDSGNCQDGLAAYHDNVSPSDNLAFEHKGVQFIGLDSGADFMPDYEMQDLKGDRGIESAGLSAGQMSFLHGQNPGTPKILFMHSPLFTGSRDEYDYGYLEDASIASNRQAFLSWASFFNLQLALTGHGHSDEVRDASGYLYSDIRNADSRPLFIQTQSATHDSGAGHGYRLVDADENGDIKPRAVSATGEYVRLTARLSGSQDLRVFESMESGRFATPFYRAGLAIPFFAAESSRRVIAYDLPDRRSKAQVIQTDPEQNRFGLDLRMDGIAYPIPSNKEDQGYYFGALADGQFAHLHLESKIAELRLLNAGFTSSRRYQLKADWSALTASQDIGYARLSDSFAPLAENKIDFHGLKYSLVAKLFSPAEMLVIDEAGKRTGISEHEPVEEIPFSLSDQERERVLVYSDQDLSGRDFTFQVRGIPDVIDEEEDEFGLSIVLKTDGNETGKIEVKNWPIASGSICRFHADWERINDYQGLIVETDADGDGVFELKAEFGRVADGSGNPYLKRLALIEGLENSKGGNFISDSKVDSLISTLRSGLDADYWQNDYYLSDRLGGKVWQSDQEAIRKIRLELSLDRLLGFELGDEAQSAFRQTLAGLLESERMLSQTAVNAYAWQAERAGEMNILRLAQEKIDGGIWPREKEYQISESYAQAWRLVINNL